MNNKIKKSKGFTLTELIVVIVIIGILAAVLIPTLTGYIKKANQSADEQEVAMLNKMTMLWDYEDNKPSSVKELKAMLEEEGYTGDYSLRVKGNYLWYDTEINRFLIIESDVIANLESSSNTMNLSTKKTSDYFKNLYPSTPEGLISTGDNQDKEVWLVGGNGELIENTSNLRNLADKFYFETEEDMKKAILNAYNFSKSINMESVIENFVESSIFYAGGSINAFDINFDDQNNAEVQIAISIEDRDYVVADIVKDVPDYKMMEEFYELIIKENIEIINSLLKIKKIDEETGAEIYETFAKIVNKDKQNADGSFSFEIEIYKSEVAMTEAKLAFSKLVKILKEKQAIGGYVTPIQNGKPIDKKTFQDCVPSPIFLDLNNITEEILDNYTAILILCAINYTGSAQQAPVLDNLTMGHVLGDDINSFRLVGYIYDENNQIQELTYNFSFVDKTQQETTQYE